jgi:hypothetical protein
MGIGLFSVSGFFPILILSMILIPLFKINLIVVAHYLIVIEKLSHHNER